MNSQQPFADVLEPLATIGVVDDDEALRTALGRLLSAFGYRAELYADSETLLESGRLRRFDCLILDVNLPGMSGLELQAHLRTAGSRVPIIFLSAVTELHAKTRAALEGCVAYLEKPVRAQQLLETMRVVL